MTKETQIQEHRIDQFFSGPGARADQWRDLVEAAKAWAGGRGERAKYEALLNDLAVVEEFHGYPGLQLMVALKESAAAGDAATSLGLSTRIVQALMTRSFRQHAGDWSVNEDDSGGVPDLLPAAFGHSGARRPYFETLIVTGVPATNWQNLDERMAHGCDVRSTRSSMSRSSSEASRTPSVR